MSPFDKRLREFILQILGPKKRVGADIRRFIVFHSTKCFSQDHEEFLSLIYSAGSEAILNIKHHAFNETAHERSKYDVLSTKASLSLSESSRLPIEEFSKIVGEVGSFLRIRDSGIGLFKSLSQGQDGSFDPVAYTGQLITKGPKSSSLSRGYGLPTYIQPLETDRFKYLCVRSGCELLIVEHQGSTLSIDFRHGLPHLIGTEITWSAELCWA